VEKADCLFGHRSDAEPVFSVRDRLGDGGERFRLMRCRECGLYFLSPRPAQEDIVRYYPYERYGEVFAGARQEEASWWQRWQKSRYLGRLCRFVERAKTEGRILDVGCGTGEFLAHLRARGAWEVQGVDLNARAVEYVREKLRLPVSCGRLEEMQLPESEFDVVTMWNVLEHLHDPAGALAEARRVIRNDGILALSLPDGDSLDRRLFGSHWVGFDPPRHLYTFTRPTVGRLLAEAGFEILRTAHIAGSYHSFVASARFWLSDSSPPLGERARRFLSLVVSSGLAHVLLLPYLRLSELIGKAAIVSVLARPVVEDMGLAGS
jgi:SAM-dependent methyltransferase